MTTAEILELLPMIVDNIGTLSGCTAESDDGISIAITERECMALGLGLIVAARLIGEGNEDSAGYMMNESYAKVLADAAIADFAEWLYANGMCGGTDAAQA